MENSDWFNMWEKQNFPYKELLKGDIIYWLDTVEKCIFWKTEVVEVERFYYFDKKEIYKKYKNSMSEKYFDSRPDKGYFLHYRIKVLEQNTTPKPPIITFHNLAGREWIVKILKDGLRQHLSKIQR